MGQTITRLEVQPHDQERVNVYLDGEFAFGLPVIEAARLRKGQVLSPEEIISLQQIDDVTRAFDRAVPLLARRPYSSAEIRRYLEKKGTGATIIDEALAKMERLGYLDDRAFAEFWVESRDRFRPRGVRALRYELQQKGITSETIEEVLAVYDTHDAAYRAAQEQIRRMRVTSRQEFRNKLGAFLVRRGFGYDIVREVIEEIIQEQPDIFENEE